MGAVSERTKANAKKLAHDLHGALTGLAVQFKSNGLDPAPVEKAVKALSGVAKEVQDELDAARAAKAEYHASVGGAEGELDRLRRENAELKAKVAGQ